jgi:NTP pyrophosphatase (non-canonical NTP hydrolase)
MPLSLAQFQERIREAFGAKDRRRGVEGTFLWFMEEVGELATALRAGSAREREEEFADVLAWLATLANTVGVDLQSAVEAKYGGGCPECHKVPCECDADAKP